ncbi:MAG TPA: GNAT family N-acetyltransferase [Caulobacteraceae bacterium]
MTAADDFARLRRDVADSYVISTSGRIEAGSPSPSGPRPATTAPKRATGPRLHFAGGAAGNLLLLRHDVSQPVADPVRALAAAAPPWRDPDTPPAGLGELVALLSRDAAVEVDGPEIVFRLPNGLDLESDATLVRSDTAEGERLLDRLARDGLPKSLIHAGFIGLGDFWWPWCVAMRGPDIAAMAFTPRLGETGAEIGVFTFPAFRGQGFAAAATAGWSSLPSLEGRELIYSTRLTNRSSRRVAERLGLRAIGARVRINDR